jgi:hypothetical protein
LNEKRRGMQMKGLLGDAKMIALPILAAKNPKEVTKSHE